LLRNSLKNRQNSSNLLNFRKKFTIFVYFLLFGFGRCNKIAIFREQIYATALFKAFFNYLFILNPVSIMNRFAEVKDLIMSLEGDFDKFYDKGNQAAGTRVRGGMQQLKTLAQDIRTQVQDMKNSESK
jgi:hypothetical protein